MAMPIWRRLFWQDIRRAASRADWTAGSNKPTRMPMIAMTTSNSTKVNARWRRLRVERVDRLGRFVADWGRHKVESKESMEGHSRKKEGSIKIDWIDRSAAITTQ